MEQKQPDWRLADDLSNAVSGHAVSDGAISALVNLVNTDFAFIHKKRTPIASLVNRPMSVFHMNLQRLAVAAFFIGLVLSTVFVRAITRARWK